MGHIQASHPELSLSVGTVSGSMEASIDTLTMKLRVPAEQCRLLSFSSQSSPGKQFLFSGVFIKWETLSFGRWLV